MTSFDLEVDVNLTCIFNSVRITLSRCPVALAVQQAHGNDDDDVWVGADFAWISDGTSQYQARLPDEGKTIVRAFDANTPLREIKPAKFTLHFAKFDDDEDIHTAIRMGGL